MKKLINLICILFLIAPIFHAADLHAEYFRNLNLEDGLSSTSIFAITQDKLGRMWFATKEGVNVYDGVSVRAFKGWVEDPDFNKKSKKQSAKNGYIPSGKFWIGNVATAVVTDSIGDIFFLIDNDVIKFSIHTERFSRITNSKRIWALTSQNGKIAFARNDSIFEINPNTGVVNATFKLPAVKQINHLSADSDNYYLSTSEGLMILGKRDKSIKTTLPGQGVYSTFISRNGTLWIPTVKDGLYRMDKIELKPEQVSFPSGMQDVLGANLCRFATEDHRGKIWYGSFSGLYCYNPRTGQSHMINLKRHTGGLTHPSVYGLYFDSKHNLWVSTYYGGVNYFSRENDQFINFNYDELIPEGLAHSFIKDMVMDNDGNLWFASDGAGVSCLDRDWKIKTHLTTRNPNAPLRQNNARTLEYDPKRNLLFIGTYLGGLSIYDINTGKMTNLIDNPEFEKMMGGEIHKIKRHNDYLYISSAKGMSVMDLNTRKIRHINTDKTSKMFDCNSNGDLYCVSADEQEVYKISNPASSQPKVTTILSYQNGLTPNHLCVTNRGLLIGTLGSGVVFIPKDSGKPIYLNSSNHRFPSDYVYAFSKGKGDVIYAISQGNIVKINMADLSTRSLNFHNYFPGSHLINKCALFVRDNEEVVVGSTKGISFINPDEFSAPERATDHPEIFFSRLRIQNRNVLPEDGTGILKEALPFSESIRLPHNINDFSIIIGLRDYTPSSGITALEYLLEGVDKEWQTTGNNEINYRNLSSGSYTLHVRRPGGEEISLKVVVATPWYNRWWAWLLYIAAAAILAYIIIRKSLTEIRLRKMLNEAELEREQLERVNQILRGPVNEEDVIENPMDRKLVERVTEIINSHMDNSELDILQICREIGMSRSLFFNKFKSITGLTPKTFILNYRLKYAASLLTEQPHLSVSEVAYQSGFSTAAYFSRCFKKQFGISPLSYRKDTPSSTGESESVEESEES